MIVVVVVGCGYLICRERGGGQICQNKRPFGHSQVSVWKWPSRRLYTCGRYLYDIIRLPPLSDESRSESHICHSKGEISSLSANKLAAVRVATFVWLDYCIILMFMLFHGFACMQSTGVMLRRGCIVVVEWVAQANSCLGLMSGEFYSCCPSGVSSCKIGFLSLFLLRLSSCRLFLSQPKFWNPL